MATWVIFALITSLALACADIFVKLAAGKLSNSLAMLIYGICTFAFGLIWVVWQRVQGGTQFAQTSGVFAAAGVGLAFSFVTLGIYITFGAGAPVSQASPTIRLSGLLLASLIGLLFFREPFTPRYMAGALLAIAGVYLIVTR